MLDNIKESFSNFFVDFGVIFVRLLFTIFIGVLIIKILKKIVRAILEKWRISTLALNFALTGVNIILYVFLGLTIFELCGVEISGIVALLSAAGIAVALSLQDSLKNIASGLILATNQELKEGDYIEIANIAGKVNSIRLFVTKITTIDNKTITVPNSIMINNCLVNYTANSTRRVEFEFNFDYQTDIDAVKKLISLIVGSSGKILQKEGVEMYIKKLNDDYLILFVGCWCKACDYWTVYYDVLNECYNAFNNNGIKIPHKVVDVNVIDSQRGL